MPKAKRSELAEVMEILVKEGKIDVISDGRYQKSRGIHNDGKTGKETAAPESRAEEDAMTDSTERMERTATQRRSRVSRLSISRQSWTLPDPGGVPGTRDHTGRKCPEEVIPNDYNGRLDLKSWQMVTIDGEGCQRPR